MEIELRLSYLIFRIEKVKSSKSIYFVILGNWGFGRKYGFFVYYGSGG
jgi:hypothetical protein